MKKIKFENLAALCGIVGVLGLFGAFAFEGAAERLTIAAAILAAALFAAIVFARRISVNGRTKRFVQAGACLVFCAVLGFSTFINVGAEFNFATQKYAQYFTVSATASGGDNSTSTAVVNGNTINVSAQGYSTTNSCNETTDSVDTISFVIKNEGNVDIQYDLSYTNASGEPAGTGKVLAAGSSITVKVESNSGKASAAKAAAITISNAAPVSTGAQVTTIFANATRGSEGAVYSAEFGGTYTIDGNAVSETVELTNSSDHNYALAASPASGYSFYAWMSANGGILSNTATHNYIATEGETDTVWPLFIKDGSAIYYIDGASPMFHYGYMDDVIAESSSNSTIVLIQSGTMYGTSGTEFSLSGQTLLLPYAAGSLSVPTETKTIDGGWNSTFEYANTRLISAQTHAGENVAANILKPHNVVTYTLTIPADTTLNVGSDAKFIIGGTIASGHVATAGICGGTAGAHSNVQLEGTVNVSGILSSCGYVLGGGQMNVASTGAVYQPFALMDHRSGPYAIASNQDDYFPFVRFATVNIQCDVRMAAGATMDGYVDIYTTAISAMGIVNVKERHNVTPFHLIGDGDNCLIRLSSGYMDISYDASRYVNYTGYNTAMDRVGTTTMDFYGDAKFNKSAITVTVAGEIELKTSDNYFPVPYNYQINLNSGTTEIANKLKLLPGSSLYVKEGATLNVSSELAVMSGLRDHATLNAAGGIDTNAWFVYHYPSTDSLKAAPFSGNGSANLTVDGTMNVTGTFGGLVQTNGTGTVKFDSKAKNSATVTVGSKNYRSYMGVIDVNATGRTEHTLTAQMYNAAGELMTLKPGATYVGADNAAHTLGSYAYKVYVSPSNNTPQDMTQTLNASMLGSWKCADGSHVDAEPADHNCDLCGTQNISACPVDDDSDRYCDICHKNLCEHVFVPVEGYAATCEADGLENHYKCDGCGRVFTAQSEDNMVAEADLVISAIGHDYAEEVTIFATCETAGEKTFTCQNDASHTYTEPVEATGHDYDDGVVTIFATCETAGEKIFTCQNDASHTYTAPVEATGHDYDDGVVTIFATCETEGEKTFTCQNDETHTFTEPVDLDETNHANVKKLDAVAPDCTNTGLSEGSKCEACGVTIDEQTEVPALGHKYGEPVWSWAEDYSTAAATFTCGVCQVPEVKEAKIDIETDPGDCQTKSSTSYTASVEFNEKAYSDPKTVEGEFGGHKLVNVDAKAPSCTEHGWNAYEYCELCDYTTYKEISTIDHTPGETVVKNKKDQTCIDNGSYDLVTYCTICEQEASRETVTIYAQDHQYFVDFGEGEVWLREPDVANVKASTFVQKLGVEAMLQKVEFCTLTAEELSEGFFEKIYSSADFQEYVVSALDLESVADLEDKLNDLSGGDSERANEIKANAAVFYAADLIISMDAENTVFYLGTSDKYDGIIEKMSIDPAGALRDASLTYAMYVAYANWTGDAELIAKTESIVDSIKDSDSEGFIEYITGQDGLRDIEGLHSAMRIAHNSVVLDSSTAEKLVLNGFADTDLVSLLNNEINGYDHICPFCNEVVTDCIWEEATCTEPMTCILCGKTEGDALGHDYDEVVVEPSCTAKGSTTYTCGLCGHSYTEEIDALEHTEIIDEAKAPTCTETGLTEGKHCSVCQTVLVAQDVVDALDHDYDEGVVTPPTCTEDGYTTYTCKHDASHSYVADKVEAGGHKHVEVVTPPTCTAKGYTTYSCTNCDDSYVDAYVDALDHSWDEGTVTEAPDCTSAGIKTYTCGVCTATKTEAVDSTGHTETDIAAVEPTCTEAGYTVGTKCSVCQAVLVAPMEIPAAGHKYEEAVTPPTCTAKGYTTYTCQHDASHSYVDNYVDAAGHTEVIDEAKAPTCTETGLTEGKHCSVCQAVLVAQDVVDALDHDYDEGVVTPPTCTAKGYTTYTCQHDASHSYVDNYVDAAGHTEVIDEAKAPTCTETGLTEGKHCSACDTVIAAQETVASLGHDYEGVVTTAPTCTEKGVKTFTCKNDATHTYTEDVAAAGHTEVVDEAKAPTCTETGLTEGKHCETCGTVIVKQETVSATGEHNYENGQCTMCEAKEPVTVSPYDFGQNSNIRLIEPWGLNVNLNVYHLTAEGKRGSILTAGEYTALEDYGVYLVRESKLGIEGATQDNVTVEDIVNNPNVVHYTKDNGKVKYDSASNRLTSTFDEGLYTYELSDSVFVLYYVVEDGVTFYAPIRERNLSEMVNTYKDDVQNFPKAKERDVYAKMAQLEANILVYRDQFEDKTPLPIMDAPTLSQNPLGNPAEHSLAFGHNMNVILIEPWGLQFNGMVTSDDTYDDYGVVVYYDTDGKVAAGTITNPEDLLALPDARVFTVSNGDATVVEQADGRERISAVYNSGIFTYQMKKTAYVMFFVREGDNFYYGPIKERSIDAAIDSALTISGMPDSLEGAVYYAMKDMYSSIRAYREDYGIYD